MALTERLALLVTGDMSDASKGFKGLAGDAAKLDKSVAKSTRGVEKIGVAGQISGAALKAGIVGGAGLAGAAVIKFGKDSIDAASSTAESVSKMNTVFGDSAAEVAKFSKSAESIGLSERAAADALGTFGNLFTQLKIGTPEAAKMSTQMTALASDFASFHNADITEVIQAQTAAFRGEYDALQRFVPTINAAAVQTEAMAATGKKNAKSLTDQEKATATYTLMIRGAGKAQGDFARTADGAANKERKLAAQFENTQAAIGKLLIPAYSKALDALSAFAGGAADAAGAISAIPPPVTDSALAFARFAGAAFLANKAIGAIGSRALEKMALDFSDLNLAQGYATKSTGALRGAIGGLASKISPATAAIIGLSAVYTINTARAKENEAATANLVDRFLQGGEAAAQARRELEKSANVKFLPGVSDAERTSVLEGSKAYREFNEELKRRQEAAGPAVAAQEKLSQATRAFADLLHTGTASAAELKAAEDAVAVASGKVATVQDQVSAAMQTGSQKAETLSGELAKQRQATLDLTSAKIAAFDSEFAYAQAQDAVSDALRDVREKQAAVTEATKKHGKTSKEARAAAEDLSDSQRGLWGEMLSVASAARQKATDQSKLTTVEGRAIQGSVAYRKELERQAGDLAPGSPLRRRLEGYIATLKRTEAKLKPAKPKVDTRSALEKLRELERRLTNLPDETVNVNIVTRQRRSAGRGETRDSGGPVRAGVQYRIGGRGEETFTSDVPGYITPHGQRARAFAGASSGGETHVHYHAHVVTGGVVGLTKRDLETALVTAQEKLRRAGKN